MDGVYFTNTGQHTGIDSIPINFWTNIEINLYIIKSKKLSIFLSIVDFKINIGYHNMSRGKSILKNRN